MKNIETYAENYMNDYQFEVEMVRYRRDFVLTQLHNLSPQSVLEIGCGAELQAKKYYSEGGRWENWQIVEPSDVFIKSAQKTNLPNLEIIKGFFEDINSELIKEPDLIICSGLLHEVPNADKLIKAIVACMGPDSILHVNVPNALSFHRRLAVAMGIIKETKELSARNISLQQTRVYDISTLKLHLESFELTTIKNGGYFLKPFTHNQMEQITKIFGKEILEGLNILGQQEPHLASEIYIELKRKF